MLRAFNSGAFSVHDMACLASTPIMVSPSNCDIDGMYKAISKQPMDYGVYFEQRYITSVHALDAIELYPYIHRPVHTSVTVWDLRNLNFRDFVSWIRK